MIRRKQPRARTPRPKARRDVPELPPCVPGRIACVFIPVKTESVLNGRGSTQWMGKRDARIRGNVARIIAPVLAAMRVRQPCSIVLVRVSSGHLDSDNLASSQKRVRDGVADALHVDDGSDAVTWVVDQIKSSQGISGVYVEVYEPGACAETLIALGDDWIRRNAHALDVILPLLRNASKTRA